MELVRRLPKRDNKRVFYIAFCNLLKILQRRGYSVREYSAYLTGGTDRDRYKAFVDSAIELPFHKDFILTKRATPSKSLPSKLSVYIQSAGVTQDVALDVINEHFHLEERKALNMLLVYDFPIDISKNVSNGSLEVMCFQQLLTNPTTHSKAPLRVEKISEDEKQELLGSAAMKDFNLVVIRSSDQMVMFHGARPGDVLRYTDAKVYTGQAITTVEYKMVE